LSAEAGYKRGLTFCAPLSARVQDMAAHSVSLTSHSLPFIKGETAFLQVPTQAKRISMRKKAKILPGEMVPVQERLSPS